MTRNDAETTTENDAYGRTDAAPPLNGDAPYDRAYARSAAEDAYDRRLGEGAGGGSWIWWAAVIASVLWVAFVLAFAAGAAGYSFATLGDAGQAFSEARPSTVIQIVAAALAGLVLIWVAAVVTWRAQQIQVETRSLARAAFQLSEQSGMGALPSPALVGEISSAGPGHIRREVERATHAISALHSQMQAIEEALASQAAAIDEAAERAESRAHGITESLRTERDALEKLVVAIDADRDKISGAANFAALGDREQSQATLDEVRRHSEAVERKVEDASKRLADVTSEMRAALAALEQARTSTGGGDAARFAAIETAAQESVGAASGEVQAAASALRETVTPEPEESAEVETAPAPGMMRQQHLAEIRRQVEQLRTGSEQDTASDPEPGQPVAFAGDVVRETQEPPLSEPAPLRSQIEHRNMDPESDNPEPEARAENGATPYDDRFKPGASDSDWRELEQPSGEWSGEDRPEQKSRDFYDDSGQPEPETDDSFSLPTPRGLDWGKLVKAANFPDSEDDHETLDALYDVLTDPQAAALLQSAEDALASLADLGLYMEDFTPQMTPVANWRAYLDGDAAMLREISGIRAPIERGKIETRIRQDEGFERLATRFTGRYEGILRRMLTEGADERLMIELADSRSGRAYMMVADALSRVM